MEIRCFSTNFFLMELINNYVFLEKFKKGMSFALVLAVIGQIIFFFSLANSIGAILVLTTWFLTCKVVMQPYNFLHYTFSSFVIFGFFFTQFCLPVIFTLLEGKPMIFNLNFPISVFIHSFLAFLILLLAFKIYKNHINFIRNVLTKILERIRIYRIPTSKQLWIIGIIGVLTIIIERVVFGGFGEGKVDRVFLKVFTGMKIFAYLPLLLFFPTVFCDSKGLRNFRTPKFLIIIYTAVLILLGILANSRGLFMQGVTTVGLVYLLGLMLGKTDYRIFSPKKMGLVLIGLWLITGPLVDLGTAMVVVRGVRTEISSKELLEETFRTYQDKEVLRRYKELADLRVRDWDETYFDNIFLARFSNLKYSDASLELAFHLPNPDGQMQDIVFRKYLSTLPQPLLNVLQINLDKGYYSKASFGDFLFMRNTGVGYGGFRLGNFMGLGLASFGWYYLAILLVGAIILYNFMDSFVLQIDFRSSQISIVGFLSILFCFTYFGNSTSSESVTTIFNYITRGWFQTVLLYVVLFWIARKVSKVF